MSGKHEIGGAHEGTTVLVRQLDIDTDWAVGLFEPEAQFLSATIFVPQRDGSGAFEEAGSVGIQLRPVGFLDAELWWLEDADQRPDWIVGFDIVEIGRDHRGHGYGLRLVADALSEISFERRCAATIVAEPKGWQSLKQKDRGPAIAALDRHWARLGFRGDEVRPDIPGERCMWMIAHNYTPPASLRARRRS